MPVSLVVRIGIVVDRIRDVKSLYGTDETVATIREFLTNVQFRSFRAAESKNIARANVHCMIDELVIYGKYMARIRHNVIVVFH